MTWERLTLVSERSLSNVHVAAAEAGGATKPHDQTGRDMRRLIVPGESSGDNYSASPKAAAAEPLVCLRGVVEREHLGLHVDGAGSGKVEDFEQF